MVPTLKQARLAQGIRPEAIAAHLGVSVATIYNWESGRSEPTLSQARRIARFLGVDLNDLTTEAERRTSGEHS